MSLFSAFCRLRCAAPLAVTLLAIVGWAAPGCHKNGNGSDPSPAAVKLKELGANVNERNGYVDFYPTTHVEEGLPYLKDLSDVKTVVLSGSNVSDDELKYLSELTELEQLVLNGTAIGDDGLAHLAALKNLRKLNLRETKITDDGLHHLESLDQLEQLDLFATAVTEAGVKKLKQALPGTQIVFGEIEPWTSPFARPAKEEAAPPDKYDQEKAPPSAESDSN